MSPIKYPAFLTNDKPFEISNFLIAGNFILRDNQRSRCFGFGFWSGLTT